MEHILISIEDAGLDYEQLVEISMEIDNLLENDDFSELEREAITEIKEDVEQKLIDIVKANREQQLDNEMEACAFHFDHINQNEEEEDEEEEEEWVEEVGWWNEE